MDSPSGIPSLKKKPSMSGENPFIQQNTGGNVIPNHSSPIVPNGLLQFSSPSNGRNIQNVPPGSIGRTSGNCLL